MSTVASAWVVPVHPVEPVHPVQKEGVDQSILDHVHDWLERFITVVDDTDLDLLTLWAAHL